MRLPSGFRRRRELEVAMTPMIDVVFLLMVYFVWTSGFQTIELMLPTRVSQLTGSRSAPMEVVPAPEQDFDDLVVRIVDEGLGPELRFNDQPLANVAQLRQRLAAVAGVQPDATVIIDPDPGIALGLAVDAFDAARLAGLRQIAFSAPADALGSAP